MRLEGLVLVLLAGALASSAQLEKHHPHQNLTCSQGLDLCRAKSVWFRVEPHDFGPVEVTRLDVKAVLCCKKDEKCRACLLITVQLRILDEEEEYEDENDAASVTVCFYSGSNLPHYKKISFKVTPAARKNRESAELTVLEYKNVFLGSTVNVTVRAHNHSVTFPSLKEACLYADVEECKTLRVIPKFDWPNSVVAIMLADETHPEPLQICIKRGVKGVCQQSSTSIPLHAVTPCMCFEAWTEGSSSRSAFCPFTENKEFIQNVLRNMSLSVGHSETYEGHPVLGWNLTAPCRLEAEVWPCRMGLGSEQSCSEVPGFRVQRNESSNWLEDNATLRTSGAFMGISSKNHFLHCVMFQVDGIKYGPLCQHDSHRRRWSMPVVTTLLVLCLIGIVVYFFRNRLRGCVSDWEKSHCPGEARGEVLLLHVSGSDMAEAGLVCRLGMELSELGFRVSLDLWSQAELSSLGPGPWLHSKLSLLQRRGGKALLVLSASALEAACACWDGWSGQKKEAQGDKDKMDKTLPCLSDVFGSALTCVFSAHQKGVTAERFVLVQFDSQKLINAERVLPLLFKGLELYNLPSESRQLLAELCPERPESFSMRLKRLLWLRRASRRLRKGLDNSGQGLWPHAQSVLTQVGTLEEEKLPLHI